MTLFNQNTFTVLLSVHNGEKTLDRCFKSLKNQHFQRFSILCVNDASSDRTSEILKHWQGVFSPERFAILTNERNLGLTRSLNRGLWEIHTPFTARIDADDWWHEKKLEKQWLFLKNHPSYGLIGCNYTNTTLRGIRTVMCTETDTTIRNSIFHHNPFAHSCVIFDTELVKKLGGYDEQIRYGQDYDLWFRLLSHTKAHNLQEFLCFRNAESGISQEKQNAQMKQCIKTQLKYLRQSRRPFWQYWVIIEPLLVMLTPDSIKRYKRAHS